MPSYSNFLVDVSTDPLLIECWHVLNVHEAFYVSVPSNMTNLVANVAPLFKTPGLRN